jgi:chromosome segregation ATPase
MASKRRSPAPRTSLHAVAVMLESLDKKFDALAEGQRASEQRIMQTMDERFAQVNRRFEILEAAVRQLAEETRRNREEIQKNSEEIQKNSEEIRKNSEEIRRNREEIERLQADMQRFDRTLQGKLNQGALDSLERRVSALEARLGIPTS